MLNRTDPLTPAEVEPAAQEFFSLFSIIRKEAPKDASTEDCLKIMEAVSKLAHKRRADALHKDRFGFNKNDKV